MTILEFNHQVFLLKGALFSFAMKLAKDPESAKDLCQETLLRAFANKDRFVEGTNFRAWIMTIMRNCFINDYRRRRIRSKAEGSIVESTKSDQGNVVHNQAYSTIMMKELHGMLDSLGECHRTPFEMFCHGFEYHEISEQLKVPIGTIKSRIFFARKKMKGMIAHCYGAELPRRA